MAVSTIKPTAVHIQSTPATVWNITHGLLTEKPAVNVWVEYDGIEQMMLPKEIKAISNVAATITFSVPTAGAAVFG
jgi:hypothetical protein